jgi:hypothetical protein
MMGRDVCRRFGSCARADDPDQIVSRAGVRYVMRCLSNEMRNVYVVAEVLW